MTDQNIELSRDGIKLSYLRFLSDSAAGQIIILMGIAAYYYPVFGKSLKHDTGLDMSPEVKILVLVMLFLLSTPLGLAVNALSYFLLSPLQKKLQGFWFNGGKIFNRSLLKHTRHEFQNERWMDYFNLREENWYDKSQFIKESLRTFLPHIPHSLDHIRGLRTLFRNISLLSGVCFVLVVITRLYHHVLDRWSLLFLFLICLFLFFGPILISSLLAFHYTSQIFLRLYILSVAATADGESNNPEMDFEKGTLAILLNAAESK